MLSSSPQNVFDILYPKLINNDHDFPLYINFNLSHHALALCATLDAIEELLRDRAYEDGLDCFVIILPSHRGLQPIDFTMIFICLSDHIRG
jgi:hypothetical protein